MNEVRMISIVCSAISGGIILDKITSDMTSLFGATMTLFLFGFLSLILEDEKPKPTDLQKYWRKLRIQHNRR